MQFFAYAAMLAIVAPVSWMVWLAFTGDRIGIRNIRTNLGVRTASTPQSGNVQDRLTAITRQLAPDGYVVWLDKQLAGAGRPKDWPLGRILMVKPLLALGGGVFGVLLFLSDPSAGKLLLAFAVTAIAYFVPDLLIRSNAQKRREAIRLELPNSLDQMLISVQAGLGFEAAMARAAENGKGPLADEFIRTLQDIQVGRSRKDAYLDMSQRVDVPDVRSFIRAVVQADAYGIAIAKVLKAQAQEMRTKRRQRAEEHAMKIPVKILFPLIFCIFPTLFIILLGPAVMKIIAAFS
ncbi:MULTISPECIES: type II secretion system F family protein [Arthrobacter]|uniref:Tight adherence protein C n=1 Tax=Arthrobacter bambusae TaxID=1338426 RepID=A0AAW8DBX4_9MICC|nr:MULTISPECIES: type II secretion system F family protein [Arthrobacter]MDP9903411.1 tight adherence protein C [Arthrobacter bambusae]MDQ0128595.1 tight adherence protein C [Arthrobacter bambusae]MDQ0179936.1 tight adherence protein C [Arthrobacter bambusae]GAP57475.1 type II secretion system protein [Arthrobacter sp. Hiyo1]